MLCDRRLVCTRWSSAVPDVVLGPLTNDYRDGRPSSLANFQVVPWHIPLPNWRSNGAPRFHITPLLLAPDSRPRPLQKVNEKADQIKISMNRLEIIFNKKHLSWIMGYRWSHAGVYPEALFLLLNSFNLSKLSEGKVWLLNVAAWKSYSWCHLHAPWNLSHIPWYQWQFLNFTQYRVPWFWLPRYWFLWNRTGPSLLCRARSQALIQLLNWKLDTASDQKTHN